MDEIYRLKGPHIHQTWLHNMMRQLFLGPLMGSHFMVPVFLCDLNKCRVELVNSPQIKINVWTII